MIFSEHGIPDYVFTDQQRQFKSAEFQEFARCYQFEILHLTPTFQQSTGVIEAMVIIVKQTMSKAEQSGENTHLAC